MVVHPSKRTARGEQAPGGFHLTRVSQFVCAFIVSGIQAHFIYRLARGNFGLPYLFFVILIAALLTIANFFLSNILYAYHYLNLKFSAVVQGFLIVIWAFCFVVLAKATSSTIGLQCSMELWANDEGIQVCREYKVLLTFVLMATIASIAAFAHDISTIRLNKGRGKYALTEETKPLQDNSSSVSVGGAWDVPPAYGGAGQSSFELMPRATDPLAPDSYNRSQGTADYPHPYEGDISIQPHGPDSYGRPQTGNSFQTHHSEPYGQHHEKPYDPYPRSDQASTHIQNPGYYQGPGSYHDVSAQQSQERVSPQSAGAPYQSYNPSHQYSEPAYHQSTGYQNPIDAITYQSTGYQVPSEQLDHTDTTYRRS